MLLDGDLMPERRTSLFETALRHDRMVLLGMLAITLLCWAWIVPMARDMYGRMDGPSAWMMTTVWDWPHLVLLWSMWAVMMAAMMLPSAAPMLILFTVVLRRKGEGSASPVPTYLFAAGYLLVWALFSAGVTLLQRVLTTARVLTPMMEVAEAPVSALLLLAAGVYQWTPLKRACLRTCQSPLSFLTRHWRRGTAGALGMGAVHGAYCLGCCWALMLLLFVGGVMNLWVIAALTVCVVIEKIAPGGGRTAQVTGGVLVVGAIWAVAHR